MSIQELRVRGYRSFRDIRWRPSMLNLVVGPNGSGKSNLLRVLELIAETSRGRLAQAMKPGGIVPLLWDYRAPSLDWTVRMDPVDPNRDPVKDALTLEVRLEHLLNTSSYRIAADSLGNCAAGDEGTEPSPLWIYRRDARQAIVYHQQQSRLVPLEDVDINESLLPQIADPSVNPIPTHTRRFLEGWRIYHDVHVERGSPMRLPATTQVATLVEPDGSNLASVLHTLYTTHRNFKTQIDLGMRAGFGPQFEELVFQPAAAQQIQLAVRWKSSNQPHSGQDLSDGTLRFLFLLTVLASPAPATLIAIDEPETGLHPSMLPVVAEYAAEAASRTQVVLTTHSPVLLDAFSATEPQVTLMHWEDGETNLFSLTSQSLAKWLEEYRLGSLFTSGDLEALASPPVEPVPGLPHRLGSLPLPDTGLAGAEAGV